MSGGNHKVRSSRRGILLMVKVKESQKIWLLGMERQRVSLMAKMRSVIGCIRAAMKSGKWNVYLEN